MSAPNHILAHRLELASALQLDWRAERVQFDLVVFFNKAKLLCFPGKQVNLFTASAILLKNSLSIPILLHYTMQARLLIGNSLGQKQKQTRKTAKQKTYKHLKTYLKHFLHTVVKNDVGTEVLGMSSSVFILGFKGSDKINK